LCGVDWFGGGSSETRTAIRWISRGVAPGATVFQDSRSEVG
jgi:hypothetical protein